LTYYNKKGHLNHMHYKLSFQIFVDNWSPTGYDLLNVLSAIVFVCVEKLCGTCIHMCCINVELKACKSIPNHKEGTMDIGQQDGDNELQLDRYPRSGGRGCVRD
jgi:hypothetical protein